MRLLDTTFIIDLLNGKIKDNKIRELESDSLCVTHLNTYEVFLGIFHLGKNLKIRTDEAKALFSRLHLLEMNETSAITAARIRAHLLKIGKEIDDIDCLLAGIALENGITTIVTKNKDHFERIPGISVETY